VSFLAGGHRHVAGDFLNMTQDVGAPRGPLQTHSPETPYGSGGPSVKRLRQFYNPTSIGRLDNLFGVKVITNTFVSQGAGVVSDTSLAARYFVRQSLVLDQNPWSDLQWTTNQISFRAEMRSVLAVLRPTAVCIVSGLGSLGGS
jgi:hypothetical protein